VLELLPILLLLRGPLHPAHFREKGHVRHQEDGKRYLYSPVEPPHSAARSALLQVVTNFFAAVWSRR